VARYQKRPTLDGYLRDSHFNSPRFSQPISPPVNIATIPADRDQIAAGLRAALPLDLSGVFRAGVRKAQASRDIALQEVSRVRLELLHQVANLYRDLQSLNGDRQAREKEIAALKAAAKVRQKAVDVGRAAPVEIHRLHAEVALVQAALAFLQGSEATFRARIGALLGEDSYQGSILPPLTPPQEEPTNPQKAVRRSRPDLLEEQSVIEALKADLDVENSQRKPSASVEALAERNRGYGGGGKAVWTILTRINLPFFDGGTRRSRRNRVRAQMRSREAHFQALAAQARADIAAAKATWKASKLRVEATKEAAKAAKETEKIQHLRYREGRLSAADLVDATAALSRASAAANTALVDQWRALDQLRRAQGNPPIATPDQK
jgi:outer membrane protein TolC